MSANDIRKWMKLVESKNLRESDNEEGIADLLAAVEEEFNDPGNHIDNVIDVMNATHGKGGRLAGMAREWILRYIDEVQDGADPVEDDVVDLLAHSLEALDRDLAGKTMWPTDAGYDRNK